MRDVGRGGGSPRVLGKESRRDGLFSRDDPEKGGNTRQRREVDDGGELRGSLDARVVENARHTRT